MRETDWDISSFPILHPSGKFGLNYKRPIRLTPQKYFAARMLNRDKRWRTNPAYLFSAVYYVERNALERNASICSRRGTINNREHKQLEDVFHVFDKIPGTPQFWKGKRRDLLAQMEAHGGFTFFFTLSSADKRWQEVFISILRQEGRKIIFKKAQKEKSVDRKCVHEEVEAFVLDEGGQEIPLEDYLSKFSKHQLIKENVLTLAHVFNHRVQSFIKHIIMGHQSPFHAKFFNYRVEFQMRGAAHVRIVVIRAAKNTISEHKGNSRYYMMFEIRAITCQMVGTINTFIVFLA